MWKRVNQGTEGKDAAAEHGRSSRAGPVPGILQEKKQAQEGRARCPGSHSQQRRADSQARPPVLRLVATPHPHRRHHRGCDLLAQSVVDEAMSTDVTAFDPKTERILR